MGDYTIDVEEIVAWFSSKKCALEAAGVALAGVHEGRGTNKPSAFADFDTDSGIGRISIWVSGEADFQVLRRSDGKDVLFHHEHVSSLSAAPLGDAFGTFLIAMKNPDQFLSN